MFGALEHHMFKQVSKAGPAFNFTVGTDMVLDGKRHNRVGTVNMEDYIQSIGQLVFFVIDFHLFIFGVCAGEKKAGDQ